MKSFFFQYIDSFNKIKNQQDKRNQKEQEQPNQSNVYQNP